MNVEEEIKRDECQNAIRTLIEAITSAPVLTTPRGDRVLAGGRDPPVCWCPPRCGAPLRPPRGVVCVPPCGGRVPRVLPPPAVGSCPMCWSPPAVLWPRPRPLL